MNLEDYITLHHIEQMNIVIIVNRWYCWGGLYYRIFYRLVLRCSYENYTYMSFGAATGPYSWAFWALIICNIIMPLSFG